MAGEDIKNIMLSLGGTPAEGSSLVAIPISLVPSDVPLAYNLYVKLNFEEKPEYVQIRRKGEKLPPARSTSLREKIDTAYVNRAQWTQFLQSLDNSVTTFEHLPLLEKTQVARNLAIVNLQDSELERSLSKNGFEKLSKISQWVALSFQHAPSLSHFLYRYQDPALYFVNHNFNVCLSATVTAAKLGLGADSLKLVALGALLHNVGNLRVPLKTLMKQGSFTKLEWDEIRRHPHHGGEILYELRAPREVVLTTLQHHERIDGNGYPDYIPGDQIHLFAKICSVVDVFDALQSPRPYQTPIDHARLISQIAAMEKQYEGQILNIAATIED